MLKKLIKSFTDDGYTVDNSDPYRIILTHNDPSYCPVVKVERVLPAIRNNNEEFLSRGNPKYPAVYDHSDDFRVLYCEAAYDWYSLYNKPA